MSSYSFDAEQRIAVHRYPYLRRITQRTLVLLPQLSFRIGNRNRLQDAILVHDINQNEQKKRLQTPHPMAHFVSIQPEHACPPHIQKVLSKTLLNSSTFHFVKIDTDTVDFASRLLTSFCTYCTLISIE